MPMWEEGGVCLGGCSTHRETSSSTRTLAHPVSMLRLPPASSAVIWTGEKRQATREKRKAKNDFDVHNVQQMMYAPCLTSALHSARVPLPKPASRSRAEMRSGHGSTEKGERAKSKSGRFPSSQRCAEIGGS